MFGQVLIYLGAVLTCVWGVAHLFPTRSVVKDFGEISSDNKNIITMEWINEGVTLIFIGILVGGVTFINSGSDISVFVYILSVIGLFVLAIISLFTGFRVDFLPYKLCPVIFTTASVLILLGIYV